MTRQRAVASAEGDAREKAHARIAADYLWALGRMLAPAERANGGVMEHHEPREPRLTHTHECREPKCTARVGCGAPRCRECEALPAHCEDLHRRIEEDILCEDHRDMPPCDWCGEREGGPLMEHDGDQIHPACRAEMQQDRADYLGGEA